MKPLLFFFLLLLIVLFILFVSLYILKCHAVRKICRMTMSEKLKRIEQLAEPFGFEYKLTQDIFTSRLDAWQQDYGYCSLYDYHAPFFHMILDCEPIYFDYNGATWLVEFWKGQYGITSGAEIGIYKADHYIPKSQRTKTMFHSVPEKELPFFSFTLLKEQMPICRLCRRHWWLTGFCTGQYCEPEQLMMKIAVSFPSSEMCRTFLSGLLETGYHSEDIYVQDTSLIFTFDTPKSPQPRLKHRCFSAWIQHRNRMLLALFLYATKPFCFTIDRILLLYECLPILVRRLLRLHHTKRGRRN